MFKKGELENILPRLKAVLLEKLTGSVRASPRLFDTVWMDELRVRAFSLLEPKAGRRFLDVVMVGLLLRMCWCLAERFSLV